MKELLLVIICVWFMSCGFYQFQNLSLAQGNVYSESFRSNDQSGLTANQDALKKEKFDLLYTSSKDIYNGYNVDVMKSLALLIIGIGWFVTSDKSREFFRKSRTARTSALIAAVILCLVHVWSSISTFHLSREKISLLSALNYVNPNYYQNYEITTTTLVLNLALIIALFGVLIVILSSLKETVNKSQ